MNVWIGDERDDGIQFSVALSTFHTQVWTGPLEYKGVTEALKLNPVLYAGIILTKRWFSSFYLSVSQLR